MERPNPMHGRIAGERREDRGDVRHAPFAPRAVRVVRAARRSRRSRRAPFALSHRCIKPGRSERGIAPIRPELGWCRAWSGRIRCTGASPGSGARTGVTFVMRRSRRP
jgi:hypothetical protein